jgi:hypothetical protein
MMRKFHGLFAVLLPFVMLACAAAPAAAHFTPLNYAQKTSPTQDDVAKAVLKAIGALALHEAGKPQVGDSIAQSIARALARQGRDELIDSALQDLSPASKAVERAAVRSLVVLALDGELARDRDRIVNTLRKNNPDMANAVEIAEFLIQLSQAVDKARR